MARRPAVGIKLDVLGKPEVVAALRDVGAEGEKLARKIERSGPPASRGLLAIDTAASRVRGKFDDLATSAGTTGDVLQQFGGWGKAAAVGIGGMTIALGAAIAKGREATREFADIGDQADRLGLSAEGLQRIQAATESVGIDAEKTADLLGELADRSVDARDGGKASVAAFQALGVSVVDAQGKLRPLNDILADVAEGFKNVESPLERVALASSLMSDEGRELIPLLVQGGDAMIRLGDEADTAGRIVNEGIVRSSQDLNREMEAQWKIIDTQLSVALVGLAPLFQDVLSAIIPVVQAVMDLSDAWRDVTRQQETTVTRNYEDIVGQQVRVSEEIAALEAKLANPRRRTFLPGIGSRETDDAITSARLDALRAQRDDLADQANALKDELDRRRENRRAEPREYVPPVGGIVPGVSGGGVSSGSSKTVKLERVDIQAGATSPLPLPRGLTSDEYEKTLKAEEDRRKEVAKTTEAFEDLRAKGIEDAAVGLAEFALGLQDGEQLLKSFLTDIARDLPAILFGGPDAKATTGIGAILQGAIGSIAGSGSSSSSSGSGGGESWIGAAFSSILGAFTGFADGGSFDVSPATSFGRLPASGGDDQLVAFRAQVGERVTVTPRGASQRGGGDVNISINVAGDATEETVVRLRQVAIEEIARALPEITSRSLVATHEELRMNPDFGR